MVLRQCALVVARHCPHRWAWMRHHMKLCLGPVATFASLATNQSKLARCCDVHGLRAKPASWKSSAVRGQDLLRVKKYWKLQCWRDCHLTAQSLVSDICSWFKGCRQRLPSDVLRQALVEFACTAATPPPVMSHDFAVYTAEMKVPAAGEALVVEDTDVATLWRQDAECYVFRVDSLTF